MVANRVNYELDYCWLIVLLFVSPLLFGFLIFCLSTFYMRTTSILFVLVTCKHCFHIILTIRDLLGVHDLIKLPWGQSEGPHCEISDQYCRLWTASKILGSMLLPLTIFSVVKLENCGHVYVYWFKDITHAAHTIQGRKTFYLASKKLMFFFFLSIILEMFRNRNHVSFEFDTSNFGYIMAMSDRSWKSKFLYLLAINSYLLLPL